jgi:FG-GAP-like repeat
MSSSRRFALCALALAATLAPAIAGSAPAQPPTAAGQPAKSAAPAVPGTTSVKIPAAKSAPATPPKIEPPDGKWLTDEQGRQYFVTPAARVEGLYKWENDEHTKVRLAYGLVFDVVSADDKFIYVKIYRPDQDAGPVPSKPTPEALAQAAATYRFDTPSFHRIDLKPFDRGLPVRGQWRNGFVIADMNGDGHPDIVHGPPRKGGSRPMIFLGDGKGNWKLWAEATYPNVPFDYGDVAVGDLNGDGHLDLVVASHLRGITAMLGDGKGKFTPWTQGIELTLPGSGETKPAFSSRAIEVYDWNRDGKPDIVAAAEGPLLATTGRGGGDESSEAFRRGVRGVRVYLNQGDGTWVAKDEPANDFFSDSLAHGDLNGDGLPDFVAGSGVFGAKEIVGLGQADGTWKRIGLDVLRPGIVPAVAVADFDKDGRDDIAVAYIANELGVWRSGIDIYYSRPGDTWERKPLVNAEGTEGVYSLAAGDLDGDGARDLAAVTGKGDLWIFLGDGKGGFVRETAQAGGGEAGCRGFHVALADLDGDGKDEVVAGFAGEGGTSQSGQVECPSGGSLRAWKAVKAEPMKKAPAKAKKTASSKKGK